MTDDINTQARAAIERPIGELVALGLQGGDQAAVRMLAFQSALRLQLADDLEGLTRLRQEIDGAIEAVPANG
jgi:hypothetical protein